jgi:hypothetical protein
MQRLEVSGAVRHMSLGGKGNDLYSSSNKSKNEMGGTYSTNVGRKRCIQGFGGET